MDERLTVKLRTAKVPRNKKWIYTLIAWVLENQRKPYQTIQTRINTSLYHNSGYYREYYEVNRTKHIKKVKERYQKNPKKCQRKYKYYMHKASKAYELYDKKMLSFESGKIIDIELKKVENFGWRVKIWRAYKMYRQGFLSPKSERIIDKALNKLKEK